MASFYYLWKNRVIFEPLSKSFFKAWAKRLLTLNELIKRNLRLKNLTKSGSKIDPTAEIGKINAAGNKKNLIIGANSFIGEIELALHDIIIIGNNVCINDGVKLLTASHDLQDPEWKHKKAAIIIEDFVWIATNAIILPGVKIGRGAVVGAAAVVSKNIEPYTIVAGNPAKTLKKKRIDNLTYNPCEFLAANLAWLKG